MFNWCFIGCGTLANKVAKVLLNSNRHKIVSCYTRNINKGKEFANKYNATFYDNALDAIKHKNVDAVYIVTPHNAHFRYAKLAIENKIPVLVEKAFTVEEKEAFELIKLAKENDVYIAEAMWTWFNELALKVKELIDNNKLGKIKEIKFNYHLHSILYAPRVGDYKRAGGALLDITVYPIAYSYKLFGYPKNIISKAVIKNKIDIKDKIIFDYDDFKVNISTSLVDLKGLEKMIIKGEKGTLSSSFFHFAKKVIFKENIFKKEIYETNINHDEGYLVEFDRVSEEIKNNLKESNYYSHKDTLAVMNIMDKIRSQISLNYDELE